MVTFPNIPIASSKFTLNVNQGTFESLFSRQKQIQNHASGKSDRWEGTWTTSTLTPDQIRQVRAFFVQLDGVAKTFAAFDPDYRIPSFQKPVPVGFTSYAGSTTEFAGSENEFAGAGVGPATNVTAGVVNGGGQTGKKLLTKHWLDLDTKVLKSGEYIQIGTQFYMLTKDVKTTLNGRATLDFEPAIRTSPEDGTPVIVENPVMISRLIEQFNGWETNPHKVGNVSIIFEEVI